MITRIYEREYVTLDYDSSVPCVVATPLKFMMPEEFKSHLNFGLDFIIKIKDTRKMLWLADITLDGTLDEEGLKWVIEDWTPRAIAAGIKHMGVVIPENEWTKIAAEEYSESVKSTKEKEGLTTAYFKDVESAKNWFREISK